MITARPRYSERVYVPDENMVYLVAYEKADVIGYLELNRLPLGTPEDLVASGRSDILENVKNFSPALKEADADHLDPNTMTREQLIAVLGTFTTKDQVSALRAKDDNKSRFGVYMQAYRRLAADQ